MREKGSSDNEKLLKGDLLLAFFDIITDCQNGKENHLRDDLINLAISNAYDDATRQGAYNALFTDKHLDNIEIKMNPDEALKASNDAQKDAIKILINGGYNEDGKFLGVSGLLKSNEVGDYDLWHKYLCQGLVQIYKDQKLEKLFTYGNAQKWVNMTVKYLYIYSYLLDKMTEYTGKKNPLDGILSYRNEFHIPLDSYIIRALFLRIEGTDSISKQINDKFKESNYCDLINNEDLNYANKEGAVKLNDGNLILNKNWKKRKISGARGPMKWSNIENPEEYEIIQREVKAQIPKDESGNFKFEPLIWENKVWTLGAEIIKKLGI